MRNLRQYGRPPYAVATVHGGPGAPGSVAALARELGKQIGVLEPLQTATSLTGQIEELRNVLRQHAALPATLVGHSWGAWLSYLLAAQYPDAVRKLIMIGCPAMMSDYARQQNDTRISRLSQSEQEEWRQIIRDLHSPSGIEKSLKIARLGELASKADDYSPLPDDAGDRDLVQVDGDTYAAVWNAAAAMRQSGELLELGRSITCPVVAIQGDYDSTPLAGVQQPLNQVLRDFRCVVLPKCGHTPWKERHARDEFYAVLHKEIGSTES